METAKKVQHGAKQELELEKMGKISGGSDVQVEIVNEVKDNSQPVKIEPTIIIDM